MVQNGSSSSLSSHPLHLLTVLVLLTLVLFSGLWSQPICGLFTFNGLKLKLSFVSVCVLGRGGFQQAGKVVALQGWEGWDRKEGFQFSFLLFFLQMKPRRVFFPSGWVERSGWAGQPCLLVYLCTSVSKTMPYGDHHICGWRVSYLRPSNCSWRDTQTSGVNYSWNQWCV